MIQPILINLHPNEYSQKLNFYPFAVKLGRCAGSCNTLNDLSNKVCVPNKREVLNLNVFNMITEISESKHLQIMYHANVNVNLMIKNEIEIKSEIMINVDASAKTIIYAKKIIFRILQHVVPKNSKY